MDNIRNRSNLEISQWNRNKCSFTRELDDNDGAVGVRLSRQSVWRVLPIWDYSDNSPPRQRPKSEDEPIGQANNEWEIHSTVTWLKLNRSQEDIFGHLIIPRFNSTTSHLSDCGKLYNIMWFDVTHIEWAENATDLNWTHNWGSLTQCTTFADRVLFCGFQLELRRIVSFSETYCSFMFFLCF